MASFHKYQTKSGTKWMLRIYNGIDKKTGKRKRITKRGFTSLNQAKKEARQIMRDQEEGVDFFYSTITFGEFSEKWLQIYEEERGVKPGTIRIRRHEINNLNKFLSDLKMINITWEIYQNVLYKLHETFSQNTIDGIHRTGRMIFKKAMQHDIIRKDSTEYAFLPKRNSTVEELESERILPKYMEKEELAQFLDIVSQDGLEMDMAIFLTLSYTGLRVGELCALKEHDIRTSDETLLSITKTYYNPNNNVRDYRLVTPKTISSRRLIDIDPVIYDALMGLIHDNQMMKKELGEEYHDENFIFVNRSDYPGYPLYPKIIQQRMTRLLKIAKMDASLTPHSFRHTHGSLLAEAGVSLERIMERLGHTDDKTTKNIYLHTTQSVRRSDAEKFGNLMQSVNKRHGK